MLFDAILQVEEDLVDHGDQGAAALKEVILQLFEAQCAWLITETDQVEIVSIDWLVLELHTQDIDNEDDLAIRMEAAAALLVLVIDDVQELELVLVVEELLEEGVETELL